jgi:predicted transcriptional regulator
MSATQRLPYSVRSCRMDDSLQRVAEVMWRHDLNYLLVVATDGCPIGRITDHQLFLAAREQDKPLSQITVSSAMSKNDLASPVSQSSAKLWQVPTRLRPRRVPIFDVEGSLVNIVREDCLARYLRRLGSQASPARRRPAINIGLMGSVRHGGRPE